MGKDDPKHSAEVPVVKASNAKFGKSVVGFAVSYRCPKCKDSLTSWNKAVETGEVCPQCSTFFVFDDAIRSQFSAIEAQKQAKKDRKEAEQAEKERLRELAKQRKAAAAADAEFERQLVNTHRREQEEIAAKQKKISQTRKIDFESGCASVIVGVGIFLSALGVLASLFVPGQEAGLLLAASVSDFFRS
jgi:hypothetical protein